MANDKDLIIGIRTEGADAAAAEIRKVDAAEKQLDQSQVKITDTARTDTSVRQKQIAEFSAWQAARMAANKEAGVSALAVSASHEIEEKSSREASSAAMALAAAEEEAAKRRGIAAREASIAIEAEAKRILAARRAEEKAAGTKERGTNTLSSIALRALTPQTSGMSALTSLATNTSPALTAVSSLAGKLTIVGTVMAGLAAISKAVFKGVSDDMDVATAAGSKFEQQNEKSAMAIRTLGNLGETFKIGFKEVANSASAWIDKTFAHGAQAAMKAEANQDRAVKNAKASYQEIAEARLAMNQKILDADLKLQDAQNALARGREERAKMDSDKSAANEIARIIQRNATENQKIILAIDEAQRIQKEALESMRNDKATPSLIKEQRKIYDDAEKEFKDLNNQLTLKIQTDGLALQNSIEDALDKAKTKAEDKLTANAEKLQSMIESVIEEKGSDSQYATKDALQRVQKLFEVDGKITMEEAEKLSTAAQQFWSSADTVQLGMRDGVSKLMASDQKALDAYKALKDQVATSTENQSQAVEAAATSKAALTEIGKNVEITNTKAGEVKAAVTDQRETTIKAIKGIAPIPAETAKVTAAVEQVKGAIDEQGNAIIKALSSVTSGMGQVTSRLNEQQQQINQIFARLR